MDCSIALYAFHGDYTKLTEIDSVSEGLPKDEDADYFATSAAKSSWTGRHFPDWSLEPRRRAERAIASVVMQAYVEGAADDILAYTAIPKETWKRIWSNNPPERLDRENRRRPTSWGSSPVGSR